MKTLRRKYSTQIFSPGHSPQPVSPSPQAGPDSKCGFKTRNLLKNFSVKYSVEIFAENFLVPKPLTIFINPKGLEFRVNMPFILVFTIYLHSKCRKYRCSRYFRILSCLEEGEGARDKFIDIFLLPHSAYKIIYFGRPLPKFPDFLVSRARRKIFFPPSY